jgi:hypothetical protein
MRKRYDIIETKNVGIWRAGNHDISTGLRVRLLHRSAETSHAYLGKVRGEASNYGSSHAMFLPRASTAPLHESQCKGAKNYTTRISGSKSHESITAISLPPF